MSLSVGPLCTSLISAWFCHAGSRHNLTLPFALGINTKLLHHSAVSSTPSGPMMSCFCRCFNFSKGFCSTHATCFGGAWQVCCLVLAAMQMLKLKFLVYSVLSAVGYLTTLHFNSQQGTHPTLVWAITLRWWDRSHLHPTQGQRL